VTFTITKCQRVIHHSSKRLKHRIASCPIGYNAVLEITIYETVTDHSQSINGYKVPNFEANDSLDFAIIPRADRLMRVKVNTRFAKGC